jgi:hypothetical protein
MKKYTLLVLLPCFSLLIGLYMFTSDSRNSQQNNYRDRAVVKDPSEYLEVGGDIEGRMTELDFLLDDPRAIEQIMLELDSYDDTGFTGLSKFHPIFDQ